MQSPSSENRDTVFFVVALVAALVLAGPPRAFLSTPSGTVPLVMSSWCWNAHCGAPIAASRRVARAPKGSLVRCVFGFEPERVTASVGGRRIRVSLHGAEADWRATRGGGLTVTATAATVWVTYVGRIRLR